MRGEISKYFTALVTAVFAIWLISGESAFAQGYPVKTIRYVVPSSPGGGADVLGRITAERLTASLKQQIVVDNRAGASGNIGAQYVATSLADGYTLLQANIIHAANVSLFKNLTYDLVRDFAPITLLASAPAIVVVHPSLPVKSIKELIAFARKQPGAINFSSAGAGSSSFLAVAGFMSIAGVEMLHVPYKGGGPALLAVVTGETSVMFSPLGSSQPHIGTGKLRPLAVTTKERFPTVPDYPTVEEGGLRGYTFENWYGLVVPANTPPTVISTLHETVTSLLREPAFSKRLVELGYVPVGNRPEEFGSYIKSQVAGLRTAIQKMGSIPY